MELNHKNLNNVIAKLKDALETAADINKFNNQSINQQKSIKRLKQL